MGGFWRVTLVDDGEVLRERPRSRAFESPSRSPDELRPEYPVLLVVDKGSSAGSSTAFR